MLSVTHENREETSQPWDGPCEGKSVELKQLLESICADIQAAVLAVCCAQSVYSTTDVEELLSRSQPPSQKYLTPCDTALLTTACPQLMLNFVEDETVQIMLLGLCGSEAFDCVVHGVEKNSKLPPSQRNPVDAGFRFNSSRMAAVFVLVLPYVGALVC